MCLCGELYGADVLIVVRVVDICVDLCFEVLSFLVIYDVVVSYQLQWFTLHPQNFCGNKRVYAMFVGFTFGDYDVGDGSS